MLGISFFSNTLINLNLKYHSKEHKKTNRKFDLLFLYLLGFRIQVFDCRYIFYYFSRVFTLFTYE